MSLETIFETEYEPLVLDNNYLICKEFPHEIIHRASKKTIRVTHQNNVFKVHLNYKPYILQFVIASQWVPNPHNYRYVKFKNVDLDNVSDAFNKDNLEWSEKIVKTFVKKKGKCKIQNPVKTPEVPFEHFLENYDMFPFENYYGKTYPKDTYFYVPAINAIIERTDSGAVITHRANNKCKVVLKDPITGNARHIDTSKLAIGLDLTKPYCLKEASA